MQVSKLMASALSTLTLAFTVASGSISSRSHSAVARPSAGNARDLFLRKILQDSPDYGGFSQFSSRKNERLKVGIVGAGAAGLYTAIILDTLGIDYDILESSERIGGRIFTHRFNEAAWHASKPGDPAYYDYYDAGAMRFPGSMAWMGRVIGKANNSLVPYINSRLQPGEMPIKLIPYVFHANNTFNLFNDRLTHYQVKPSAETFHVQVSEGGTTNATFATISPDVIFEDAITDLVQALEEDFTAGFNLLMQYDNMSVRQYFLAKGYSSQQIDWLETFIDYTGQFTTSSLSENVLDDWIFGRAPPDSWICTEGGMDRIIDGMVKIIKKPVELKKRVTAVGPGENGALKVIINKHEERTYDHVINTVPLGAMQIIDMTKLYLDYRKKLAIRKIQYDSAEKIGIKFKTRWWETLDSGFFQGGQSMSDLPIRKCVYPSYGIDVPGVPGTMIASYTIGQDSFRLGAYNSRQDSRERIIEITLRNLAAMNNVTYEFLQSQYVDSHLWNWYESEDSVGAFAAFGPGDFSTVMPALMMPAANGSLHFAGEALSSGHGWIIGAVNSAYRAVAEVLAVEAREQDLARMIETWGLLDEIDMGWYSRASAK